ncbi:Bug family tripartite tricarboxylate transporter substrate binding protein [Ancylobacter oerskovii]|uniref:Bug family tripartite tricarboxylate transporter substrate binding protein n=1 Tax=Ancylobacter oerskovii TaxID=459519 RepID=A0ABW4YW65_9HYPH|nr:tripartite tricarboxylate transporter substrate-binding protein [Ancylobacter oerskovii]MBS7542427.1 tripartite tricarboxylate transporter substrate binding protein [Ancylobacter oerskovii]
MKTTFRSSLAAALMLGAFAAPLLSPAPAQAQIRGIEILAPGGPGSSYDSNARSVQSALQNAGLATGVQVSNLTGGGGLIALTQFVTSKKRSPYLLSAAFSLLSNTIIQKSAVTFDDVTPLARLTGDYQTIAVGGGSDIKTLADFIERLKKDPGSVPVGIGSPGGIDHVFLGRFAKAIGVDPTKLNVVVINAGGETLSQLMGGHIAAAVAGRSEFAAQYASGQLRELGVASAARLAGVDTPTLKEQGVDVELATWRGLLVQKDMRPAEREKLGQAIAEMVKTPAWKETLAQRGWIDIYMPEAEFAPWLRQQKIELEATLTDIGVLK